MKKKFLISLCFATILIAGCYKNQATKINPEKWLSENGISIEESFDNQINKFQYINDFENFLSYNILSIREDKPYNSTISFNAKFDEKSSIQGGIEYYQEKFSKSNSLETFNIKFDVEAENYDTEPFDLSGDITLLHKDNEIYANLHDLGIFMGEGNVTSKMYTLLGDLITDKRVDLEVHNGGIITIDEEENKRIPHIISRIKNIIIEDPEYSPSFLESTAELLDTINSYIDLGVSTNELKIISREISYFELGDKTIQKSFSGLFQGKDSIFNLSFIASEKGLDLHLYNIKNFDEDYSDFKESGKEFSLSIQENNESEYSISFESIKDQQKVVDIEGKIKYSDNVEINANFIVEPLEIINGQKISGKLDGNIIKRSGEGNIEFPELTEDVLSLSELLSSL